MAELHQNISQIKKVTWIGFLGNIVLSAMKLTLGILGHSQAVIADAVHSLSDVSTDLAILFGVRFWTKSPDEDHPYGHGRIETFVSILIGLILCVTAISLGVHSLSTVRDPDITVPGWIAFAGAVISIFVKEALYRYTVNAGKKERSHALTANAWHHRSDALSSIPVAFTIVAARMSPRLSFLDHVGAVVISLFILYAAWKIMREGLTEMTGVGACDITIDKIKTVVLENKDVKSLHAIRSRRIGSDWFIDLHVQVDGDLTVKEGHRISQAVEDELLEKGPDILDVVVHLEPYEKAE